MSITGMAFLPASLPSGKTLVPYSGLHGHRMPLPRDTVLLQYKPRSRARLIIENAFKLSTQVPAPINPAQTETLVTRLKPFLNPGAAQYLGQHPTETQKILFRTGHQLVRAAKSLENEERLPVSLAVYRTSSPQDAQTEEPEFIRAIDLPRAHVLQEAVHPVSQAAYGIHLLRADLPRHLPPAFIAKFLDPVWQFHAKKHDKALYKPGEEFQSIKQTVASWFGYPKPKPVEGITFSEQEFDELMLTAHAIPLGLRVEDDGSRSSYGRQLFDLLEMVTQTMERQAETQRGASKDAFPARLGTICLNRQTGRLEYHDLSEILQSLAGVDSEFDRSDSPPA